MGKKKKKEELEYVDLEFKVSMYCNACERTVAKVFSKLQGVEKFITDMNNHRVLVSGRIDPENALKKLKKKTGKKVEIVARIDEDQMPDLENDLPFTLEFEARHDEEYRGCFRGNEAFMFCSDENPNACCIM